MRPVIWASFQYVKIVTQIAMNHITALYSPKAASGTLSTLLEKLKNTRCRLTLVAEKIRSWWTLVVPGIRLQRVFWYQELEITSPHKSRTNLSLVKSSRILMLRDLKLWCTMEEVQVDGANLNDSTAVSGTVTMTQAWRWCQLTSERSTEHNSDLNDNYDHSHRPW